MRNGMIWAALLLAIALPLTLAALSPLLAFREPVYIAAGLSGVLGMGLILIQPLLVKGFLPLTPANARRMHRLTGTLLLALIVAHVGGLWVTSPPDVIDALLLRSPTPFSDWGVLAMLATFAAAALAMLRKPHHWRLAHKGLALIIAGGTIAHALLIEGTMEPFSKAALALLIALATIAAVTHRRPWR